MHASKYVALSLKLNRNIKPVAMKRNVARLHLFATTVDTFKLRLNQNLFHVLEQLPENDSTVYLVQALFINGVNAMMNACIQGQSRVTNTLASGA